ncbi:U6 small nuclear RNA (adenine-(43)-N(6))-methyltransferase [Leptinotarsa decemlineata]|uniref:U6 small nuclear RNA (adenine-(43)-N(6))-methyltransferase n=1 Tax=Leptinotarsa decemlineata TaxID=7539 RepID=UPI003D3083B3
MMAVNKYMHPRNIYKSPPDFKQLALEFPDFRQYVKQDITGKVTLDFKDIKALRSLSCTLLKKDFDLSVNIPLNKLIPTIPLRLNYILWLEDLLSFIKTEEQVRGIDIGTGASCVYPLLAARKNNWFMLATEVDEASATIARSNVEENKLLNLITVLKVEKDCLLQEVVHDEEYDFCMCNPPFFGSTQELHPSFKSRNLSRPKPKNSFCASVNEVVVQGGEIDFITRLINESKQLGKKVKIYTTMMGHKRSLPQLKKLLREAKVCSFKDTEFCQGNTTRWGLAWTFCEDIDLKKCYDPSKLHERKPKPNTPVMHEIHLQEINEGEFINVLLKLFEGLQMGVEEVTRNKSVRRYFISAFSNTWSNQRRKRRKQLREAGDSLREAGDSLDSIEESKNDKELSDEDSRSPISVEGCECEMKRPIKRTNEDNIEGAFLKKLKISEDGAAVFFKFIATVRLQESAAWLELDTLDRNGKRDYLHQILQYIKNNMRTTE